VKDLIFYNVLFSTMANLLTLLHMQTTVISEEMGNISINLLTCYSLKIGLRLGISLLLFCYVVMSYRQSLSELQHSKGFVPHLQIKDYIHYQQ